MCEIKVYNNQDELILTAKTQGVSDAVEKALECAENYAGSTAVILQDGVFYSSASAV